MTHPARMTVETDCCIVGAGPGGAVLALLLARKGLRVTLLEAHHDFDRDFRGDTLHASVLEILDQIGLADRLLEHPHSKLRQAEVPGGGGDVRMDLSHLPTRFPFIAIIPQPVFLDFITKEAAQYEGFRLVMGARVERLIEHPNGRVAGVVYDSHNGEVEVRANLVVGADGRFSKIRSLAGFTAKKLSSEIDVLWFRLPRFEGEPEIFGGLVNNGRILLRFTRIDHLQVGFIIPKNGYKEIRAAGIENFRRTIVELDPVFADRVETLTDWRQIPVLSVEISRCPRWYKPGLLLIGDAAHVMSPVGGIGINYAIMDAAEAANLLVGPISRGSVTESDLAAVQRKREWPTRIAQAFQAMAQKRVLSGALEARESGGGFKPPWFIRFGWVRRRVAKFIAFGVGRVRLRQAL